MSSNDHKTGTPVGQGKFDPNSQIDYKNEFYRLACLGMRLFLLIVTEACARNIGRRLELLSKAVFVPDSHGYMDVVGVAAHLDMETSGAKDLLKRNNVPAKRPGKDLLFRIGDVAERFEQADA